MALKHPYVPQDIPISGYVHNELDRTTILSIFFGISVFVFLFSFIITSLFSKSSSSSNNNKAPTYLFSDRCSLAWFLVSGLIHVIIEGFWVFNWKTFTTGQSILDQTWKEYSLADSRYVFGEPTVLGVESITAILVGPLSLFTSLLILKNSPLRHFFQIVVSTCQIYGDYIYYFTAIYPGKHYHIQDPYGIYYWGYFIALNGVWVVVPLFMLFKSFGAIQRAFDEVNNKKQKIL